VLDPDVAPQALTSADLVWRELAALHPHARDIENHGNP
jgi:hypothetical protein